MKDIWDSDNDALNDSGSTLNGDGEVVKGDR